MKLVLLITEEAELAQSVQSILGPTQAQLTHRANLKPAEQLYGCPLPDVCVLDLRKAGCNGIPVLKSIHGSAGRLPILALADKALVDVALKSGAVQVLTTPVSRTELKSALDRALASDLDPLNRAQHICGRIVQEIGPFLAPLASLSELTAISAMPGSPAAHLASHSKSMIRWWARWRSQLSYFAHGCYGYSGGSIALGELLQRAATAAAEHFGAKVEVNIAPIAPNPQIAGSDRDLCFALTEIMLNGLQANPSSRRVSVEAKAQNEHSVLIVITDTGPGFSAATIRFAEEPFFSTRIPGLGLGLHAARRIIEASGGKLILPTTPASPGVVSVMLPIAVAASSPAVSNTQASGDGSSSKLRIIIVDGDAEVASN